jgi:putative transposase
MDRILPPRRRTKVIGRLPGETSCLTLLWAVLDRASRGWRGVNTTPDGLRLLHDLRRCLLEPPPQIHPGTPGHRQRRRERQSHRIT